jgi:hypothetical protein
MNNELAMLYQWLCTADQGLEEFASSRAKSNVEEFIEDLLWRYTASFVEGPLAALSSTPPPAHLIQYFSFPLYSHFKEQSGDPYAWISRCPLFFGGDSLEHQLNNVLRYALLFRGFISGDNGFSFTGFANNPGWGIENPPPRFVVLNYLEEDEEKGPNVRIQDHSDILRFDIELNPPSLESIPKLQSHALRQAIDEISLPAIAGRFEAGKKDYFFKWFIELQQTKEFQDDQSLHRSRSLTCSQSLLEGLRNEISKSKSLGSTFDRDQLAKNLADFIATNNSLGFRKLVYLPYRTVEPGRDGKAPEVMSWGGVVLSFHNDINLSSDALTFLLSDQANINVSSNPVAPLIASMKLFVDVTTSRASINDWKHYQIAVQRETIARRSVTAMHKAFAHEIRHLQEIVEGYILGLTDKGTISKRLGIGLAASELMWSAYTESETTANFNDTLAGQLSLLQSDSFKIRVVNLCGPDLRIPKPLQYVALELLWNASRYGKCVDASPLECSISISYSADRVMLEVQNPAIGQPNFQNPQRGKSLGLDIIREIAKQMSAEFILKLENEMSIAVFSYAEPTRGHLR